MSEASRDHQLRQRFMERLTGDGDVDGLRLDVATLIDDAMVAMVDAFQKETGLAATPALLERVRIAAGNALAMMYPGMDRVLAEKGGGGGGAESDGGKEVIGGAGDGGGDVGQGGGNGGGEPAAPDLPEADTRSLYEKIPLTTLAGGALVSADGDLQSGVLARFTSARSRQGRLQLSDFPDLGKSLRVVEVLQSLGVDLSTCHRYEGPNGVPGCKIIEATINGRKKLIFVSDVLSISTFVAYDGDIADYEGKGLEVWHDGFKKGTISRLGWVKRDEYIGGWKDRLSDLLKAETGKEWGVTDLAEVKTQMDVDYFNDVRYVKSDLMKFVVALGVDSPFELTTGIDSLWGVRIKCTNGEYLSGGTYLSRAAKAHGYVKDDGGCEYKKTLAMLMTVAGYRVRDGSYYKDSRAVSVDLGSFLVAYNTAHSERPVSSVDQLTANSLLHISIICNNEETVGGHAYLRRACLLFGFEDNKFSSALAKLREIASAA